MRKMLLNIKAVKQVIKEEGKQSNKDFTDALNRQVNAMIVRACKACPTKRLSAAVIE